MPRRRDLKNALKSYDDLNGGLHPHEGWRRFVETASPAVLRAVLSALIEALPERRRSDLHFYLGLNQAGFDGSIQLRLDRIRKTVADIAQGKLRLGKGPEKCDWLRLLRDLQVIEEHLTSIPSGFQNRRTWLEENLPRLFETLAATHCTSDHPARLRYREKLDVGLCLAVAPLRSLIVEYEYRDERGELLYVVERREPKSFRQRRPDGQSGWIWSLTGIRRVLYRLPLLQGQDTVFIVEASSYRSTPS